MTRQQTSENPNRILMSAFEGPAAHRARRLGAKRIMVESNAQTPEYDGIKYAAFGRCQAAWSRSGALSLGRLMPTMGLGLGVFGRLRNRSGWLS